MSVREFRSDDADYRALSDMQRAVYPEYPFSPAEMRHDDDSWDGARFFHWRALRDGAGWVQVNHARSAFVADTYWLDVGVVPEERRKGHGTALYDEAHRDVPSPDAPTPLDKATWRTRTLEGPNALPDAFFLAIDPGGRYLGLSELERSAGDPTFLWQGLTGVRRDARGRGIAMALKLETVKYARALGVDHIKTWNDQRNRPMLRINEALGFVKQPAWITFQKDL